MVRWLKKSSKETCLTWSYMHEKSRWLNFNMAQNLDHVSFCLDGSLFEQSRFFSAQKVSHLSKKTRDRDFEPFWNWAISISHAYNFTWNMSPSMTFWAISPYHPYFEWKSAFCEKSSHFWWKIHQLCQKFINFQKWLEFW